MSSQQTGAASPASGGGSANRRSERSGLCFQIVEKFHQDNFACPARSLSPGANQHLDFAPGLRTHGIGMRYRFRWIVPRWNA